MSETNGNLLDQYLQLPSQLEEAIVGLEEGDLDLRKGNGWSIREIVCHLVEGEQLWQINLRTVIGLNGAKFPFEWYFELSQVEWSKHWAYSTRFLKAMLDLFRADTQYLADILRNLPTDIWEHYGRVTWPAAEEETRLTVREIVEIQIRHMDGHAADIQAIRALHGC